eukprot:6228471-Amphidinium_carterae.1
MSAKTAMSRCRWRLKAYICTRRWARGQSAGHMKQLRGPLCFHNTKSSLSRSSLAVQLQPG